MPRYNLLNLWQSPKMGPKTNIQLISSSASYSVEDCFGAHTHKWGRWWWQEGVEEVKAALKFFQGIRFSCSLPPQIDYFWGPAGLQIRLALLYCFEFIVVRTVKINLTGKRFYENRNLGQLPPYGGGGYLFKCHLHQRGESAIHPTSAGTDVVA